MRLKHFPKVTQQVTELTGRQMSQCCNHGPTAMTPPGSLLEMQNRGPSPDLWNQSWHFDMIPRGFMHMVI